MPKKKTVKSKAAWLVAGLGNPGPEYRETRHSIGFRVIDQLARHHGISVARKGCDALYGIGLIEGIPVLLAKPQTFMNRSGEPLSALVKAFDISLTGVIIVHDDLDLPLGTIRQAFGASSGGHRGVESVMVALGSPTFHRVRMGIGRPPAGTPREAITAYVLEPFADSEQRQAREGVDAAERRIVSMVSKGEEEERGLK